MDMREIVLDTETSGFAVEEHRIVEIGCLELINGLPTGTAYQVYLNPERDIDFTAARVHGITNEKVADAPKFGDVVEEFLQFIGGDTLVIHNAEFDMAFLNMELGRLGRAPLGNPVVDTLAVARSKLPGQRHNLDALCRYFNVDNSGRSYHGALLDAQLLAEVYIELNGGLQGALVLEKEVEEVVVAEVVVAGEVSGGDFAVTRASEAELAAHRLFVAEQVKGQRWYAEGE